MENSKKCSKCKIIYPSRRQFSRDMRKSDGFASKCKGCARKEHIEYYYRQRQKVLDYSKKRYTKNKLRIIFLQTERRRKIITKIFDLLGDKCVLCGFKNKMALQIDHLKGGGQKHRRIRGGGMNYYKDIVNDIKNYQILCANCNLIEGVKKNFRTSIWK